MELLKPFLSNSVLPIVESEIIGISSYKHVCLFSPSSISFVLHVLQLHSSVHAHFNCYVFLVD